MKQIKIVVAWLLVILWMSFIFSMSGQVAKESNKSSTGISKIIASIFVSDWDNLSESEQNDIVGNIHVFVRKASHFTIYAILSILCSNAISNHTENRKLCLLSAQTLSMLYAITDEIHQFFTDGRSCELRDVFIDSCGALTGIALLVFISKYFKIFKLKR